MSDSVWPHRRQPTRLPHPWDSPDKNTGVGCHFLLQCMKVKSESEVTQSCPTLSDPMDFGPPGSSIHGIFQARVLEWGAIALSLKHPYDMSILFFFFFRFFHHGFWFSVLHLIYTLFLHHELWMFIGTFGFKTQHFLNECVLNSFLWLFHLKTGAESDNDYFI